MKFKKIISTAMALTLSAAMVACNNPNNKKADDKSKNDEKLTFGVMGSIDAIPLVIAKEQGYFKDLGLDLNLQTFTAAKDRDAALQANELDGVLADEVAISIYQESGLDMKITGTTNGVFKLVAGKDSGINTLADLKGKKVGISERTMMDYLADVCTKEGNIDIKDVEKIGIPAMPARLEALRNKQIDAAILPAPFNDTAIADGAKEIKTINNSDIMISTTAFSQDIISKKPEAVKNFYKAYNKAIEYINKNDISKYEDIVIKTVGYAKEMKGNIKLPEFKQNYLPLENKVQAVFNWSKEKGIIKKELKAKNIINDIAVK